MDEMLQKKHRHIKITLKNS